MRQGLFIFLLLTCWSSKVRGQDLEWLVEQAPTISAILVKAFDKASPFSAKVELEVTGKNDTVASSVNGTIEFQSGKIRWEASLDNVTSTQLSENARALIRQINGDRIVVLTLPEEKASYFVLKGAQSFLEGTFPQLTFSTKKPSQLQDKIDNHLCSAERFVARSAEGGTNNVVVWRAHDLKNLPLKIQVSDGGETFRIRLKEVRYRPIAAERFQIPEGLTKHNNMEDLIQSVLIDKLKRRIGLQ